VHKPRDLNTVIQSGFSSSKRRADNIQPDTSISNAGS
jgi:hypothetical protein